MTLWMAEGGPIFNRRLSVGQSAHPVQFTSADNNDSINYADLSDFFYVWLKRGIGFLHSDLLSLPLTPKREQVVMNVYASAEKEENRKAAARQRYIDGMSESFHAIAESLDVGGMTGVVFAHTDPDAWATLIDGLLGAGLVPDATWPIDTEAPSGLKTVGQARLKTSVWMACRKREEDTGEAFLGDVLADMRLIVRERLLYFWSKGIRGADFFISAIGPALSVFGRYSPRAASRRHRGDGPGLPGHSTAGVHYRGLGTGAARGGLGDNRPGDASTPPGSGATPKRRWTPGRPSPCASPPGPPTTTLFALTQLPPRAGRRARRWCGCAPSSSGPSTMTTLATARRHALRR